MCVAIYTLSRTHIPRQTDIYMYNIFIKKVSEPPIPAVGIKNCDINKLNNISK